LNIKNLRVKEARAERDLANYEYQQQQAQQAQQVQQENERIEQMRAGATRKQNRPCHLPL